MDKKYEKLSKEELMEIISKLERKKNFGLIWESEKVPEKVVQDCSKHLPVLKEVLDKEVINDNSNLNHILIEGDNYHSLSVLNYTHRESIDVIYIDPPYNTGNKDFIYNDHYVDTEDGFKHSKWLNFMEKRLNLAKELLKDTGAIFISIDDNEQAQLKLLCDEIFGEDNFIACIPRLTKKGGKSTNAVSKNHDYVLVYQRSFATLFNRLEHNDDGFKHEDEYVAERGKYKLNQTLDYDTLGYVNSLDYEITIKGKSYYPGSFTKEEHIKRKQENPKDGFRWRWSKELFNFGLKNGFIVVKNYKNKSPRIYTKTYQNVKISKDSKGKYYIETIPRSKPLSSIDLIENKYSNDNAKKQLKKIFGKVVFDYPKPVELIKILLRISTHKNSIVLDFMGGTGTTAQAVYELNKEDKGSRKFIIATNNENNICSEVTYPRLRKIIYNSNLKYFKTDFVKNSINKDQLKIDLTKKCSEMLCLKEDIFNLHKEAEDYKIFSEKNKTVAIYFNFISESLFDLIEDLKRINNSKKLYCFTLDPRGLDESLFDEVEDLEIEAIPHKMLEVYKQIFNNWLK